MADTDMSLKKLVIIIMVILLLILGMYLITEMFVAKESSTTADNTTTTTDETSSDYIYASQTFNMDDDMYYVLFLDMSVAINKKVYDDLIVKYTEYPVYVVDLSKKVNQSILSDTSNINPTSYSNLKVKDQTLINIKNGSKASYVEGLSNITSVLN